MSTHHHSQNSTTRLELSPTAPSNSYAAYPEKKMNGHAKIEVEEEKEGFLRDGEKPSSKDQPAQQQESRLVVIATVSFYLVAALVMILVNKAVLNAVQTPLFLLFIQLIVAVLFLHIFAMLGYFQIPKVRMSTCKGLIPMISLNVIGLTFNTYCLQYVDASFYQVARGLILPFTVFFSFFLLSQKFSLGTMAGVVVTTGGFLVGVSTESLSTSYLGITFGITSSITTSVHAIFVKKALNVVKGSTFDFVYYTNLLSALAIGPLMLIAGEGPLILELCGLGGAGEERLISEKDSRTFFFGSFVTGTFGFLISIAGFLSIKVTSPTSHMISSAVRGVLQTFMGKWLFGDVITSGRAGGIAFILVGSTVYTYYKDTESRSKSTAPQASLPSNNVATYPPSSSISSSRAPHSPINVMHARKNSTNEKERVY